MLFHALLSSADFFLKMNYFKKSYRNTIRVSICLDPDEDRRSVGPDHGKTVCKTISRLTGVFR